MSDRRAAHPGLYHAEGSRPTLYGQRCSACSRVTFPPNPYGCEVCGAAAESLETQELAGSGTETAPTPSRPSAGWPQAAERHSPRSCFRQLKTSRPPCGSPRWRR